MDLWNDQVNLLNGGSAFDMPAVFVEFEQIDWHQQNAGARRGDIAVRLHIVTRSIPTHGSHDPRMAEALAVFDLINSINAKCRDCAGKASQAFSSQHQQQTTTMPNSWKMWNGW